MRTTISGRPAHVNPASLVLLMTAAMRLDVAKRLKAMRDIPGDQAARVRRELEDELQALDELAAEARVAA